VKGMKRDVKDLPDPKIEDLVTDHGVSVRPKTQGNFEIVGGKCGVCSGGVGGRPHRGYSPF